MFENLIIYGAPALTLGLGYFAANRLRADYVRWLKEGWDAAAQQHTELHKRFVTACRDANALQDELDSAQASIVRLTDALAAKNARLERIAEAFQNQQSGTAQKVVRMARGDA